MTFKIYFRLSSYLMVACGTLTLVASGGIGLTLAALFAAFLIIAWNLEETRWQLKERVSLIVVLLSLPLFYLDWRYQASLGEVRDQIAVNALAHLILFLAIIKLLQVKADRDWIFLYLISFFEVLLSAGLSISPLFLILLGLYLLCALSTILAFEIKKAQSALKSAETRLLVAPDSTSTREIKRRDAGRKHAISRRLPTVAVALLVLIFILAMPLFFIMPRFGQSARARSSGGLNGFVGFSDKVTLGEIGRLQQNDNLVMRVRIEDAPDVQRRFLRWRGVALDEFNGRAWRKSRNEIYVHPGNERGFYQIGTTEGLDRLTTQTFFVEPVDTSYLFAAQRVVALQGSFPYVRSDTEGALQTRPHTQERLLYKAFSDTKEPDAELLRSDLELYEEEYARYLQLPQNLDPRIAKLAREIILRRGARNRYDMALALETHLRQDYGYTLEMKSGGADPLSDFLFRVKEGHCEYFATAMTVMLRTQGIAARMVNGFQQGEYNEAAGAYTVTERDAHSWVEVYFPATNSWVTFDPTPAAGRAIRQSSGLQARLSKFADALDLLWFQYVVSYDKQEQKSLVTSLGKRFAAYRIALNRKFNDLKMWLAVWLPLNTDDEASFIVALLVLAGLIVFALLFPLLLLIGVRKMKPWRFFRSKQAERKRSVTAVVEFYERLMKQMRARGLTRSESETALEFAVASGMPEAVQITRAYNHVRYGAHKLTSAEMGEIEKLLKTLESSKGAEGQVTKR